MNDRVRHGIGRRRLWLVRILHLNDARRQHRLGAFGQLFRTVEIKIARDDIACDRAKLRHRLNELRQLLHGFGTFRSVRRPHDHAHRFKAHLAQVVDHRWLAIMRCHARHRVIDMRLGL